MNTHKQVQNEAQKESTSLLNLLFSGAYLGIGAYFGYQVPFYDDLLILNPFF